MDHRKRGSAGSSGSRGYLLFHKTYSTVTVVKTFVDTSGSTNTCNRKTPAEVIQMSIVEPITTN
jgi:hypothetical protein